MFFLVSEFIFVVPKNLILSLRLLASDISEESFHCKGALLLSGHR